MSDTHLKLESKTLYNYQKNAIESILKKIDELPGYYNLLYQLPTGGGKTVIFSEIARKFIKKTNKKVIILTHRVELYKQTSAMLTEFKVPNKVINSQVKELPDQDDYMCFVAMVETLNNRLKEEKIELSNIGLIIIDEAHYNSFRKLFKYFESCFILGVTATPLSSNIETPLKDIYHELLVGESIPSLIEAGFLSAAIPHTYNVGLTALRVGMNGDYTVKSSEELYVNQLMQSKLLNAYEQCAKETKTLIFNNGIRTSWYVYETFKEAGYKVRNLDSTVAKQERKEILTWFKETPGAILTSVGILTTGFDEPTIETIIMNRATKSLALYFQMIGRGSRVLSNKKTFKLIDLGNNIARFGPWTANINWQQIFRSPNYFLENLANDEDLERNFTYQMPDEVRVQFKKSKSVAFNIKKEYDLVTSNGLKSKTVLDNSINQHVQICIENSEDVYDALTLMKLLNDDITHRVKQYSYCIIKNTKNYVKWLEDDYKRQLRTKISQAID
ncbi:MAG: DEAD/DEAH box helicase family protein [Flavobacteriaceae bacterium]|nr:DEAD/DEAH box helicase family protein [Flavobacteriaceae bacterium]